MGDEVGDAHRGGTLGVQGWLVTADVPSGANRLLFLLTLLALLELLFVILNIIMQILFLGLIRPCFAEIVLIFCIWVDHLVVVDEIVKSFDSVDEHVADFAFHWSVEGTHIGLLLHYRSVGDREPFVPLADYRVSFRQLFFLWRLNFLYELLLPDQLRGEDARGFGY